MVNDPLIIKARKAGAPIGAAHFVAAGAQEGTAVQASDPAKPILGVSHFQLNAPTGGTVDVVRLGIAPVVYGGNVRAGYPLTSDAQGRAVEADLAVAGVFVGGTAEVSGVAGDIGAVLVNPHFLKA